MFRKIGIQLECGEAPEIKRAGNFRPSPKQIKLLRFDREARILLAPSAKTGHFLHKPGSGNILLFVVIYGTRPSVCPRSEGQTRMDNV
jgi:hypothetical protein